MIILDLVVIGLIILGALLGHKKGLIGIVVSFISLILAFVLDFALNSLEYSLSNNIPTPNQQKPFIAPIVAGE